MFDLDDVDNFGRNGEVTMVPIQVGALLPDVLDRIAKRFVRQTILEMMPAHWIRRADEFEAVGTPSCDQVALACRRHAYLLAAYPPDPELIREIDQAIEKEVA